MSPSPTPSPPVADLLPLTALSFDILLSLADGPRHGYGIIQEIEARSGGPMRSSTGTLYLAIQRLQREGLIERATETGGDRRRRPYALTALGREVAAAEAERLAGLVGQAVRKDLLSDAALTAVNRAPGGDAP